MKEAMSVLTDYHHSKDRAENRRGGHNRIVMTGLPDLGGAKDRLGASCGWDSYLFVAHRSRLSVRTV